MDVNEHSIKVENTAHFVSLGELNKETKEIWIVCHGYGQLAKFFIRKFKVLQKEGVYIVAPQGFHKFYLKGFSGRVGASWMTKENRDDEITDHCNFLEQLTDHLIHSASKNCKINVLGFSQGAATISRWCLQTKHTINTFVLWAGKIASDFDFAQYKSKHHDTNNYFVFGTKDQFYAVKTIEEYKTEMQDLDAIWISYEGNHSIHSDTLLRINTLGH